MFTLTTIRLVLLTLSCCLLVVQVDPSSSERDDEFGCKLQDDWLKAVTVYNNRLYLIIAKKRPKTDSNIDPFLTEDWVYSLPFASTHIDSFGRRLRMFFGLKLEATNWQADSLDSSLGWLKNLQEMYITEVFEKSKSIVLSQFNLILGSAPGSLYLDVIWTPIDQQNDEGEAIQYSEHCLLKEGKDQAVLDFGVPQEEYLVLGDGKQDTSSGFVMWLGPRSGVNGSILATGLLVDGESGKLNIPAIPYHGEHSNSVQVNANTRYYRLLVTKSISSQPYQLVKLDPIDGYTPKPLEQPRHRHWKSHQFGFLFEGVVHIWDIYRERVYLFQPKLDGSTSCLYEVLLNDYIACNDAEWGVKDKAQCPEESTPDSNLPWNVLIIMISAAAGLLLVVSLVGTALCYRGGRLWLKKKQKKRHSLDGRKGRSPRSQTRSHSSAKGTSKRMQLKSAAVVSSNTRTVRTPKTDSTHRSPKTRRTKQTVMGGSFRKEQQPGKSKESATPTDFLFPA